MRSMLWALLVCAPLANAQQIEDLGFGKAARGDLPTGGRIWQTFQLRVPEGATNLDLRLSSPGNVDLYLRANAPMDNRWEQRSDARSNGPDGNERITLTPATGLCACTYYVDVVHGDGALGEPLKYQLRASYERGSGPGATPRTAGGATDDALGTYAGDFTVDVDLSNPDLNYATYRLDVGRDVERVELQLEGARTDLDLFARYGSPMPNWSSAHHRSESDDNDETLVLSRDGVPRLRTGTYYIDIARRGDRPTLAELTGRFVRGYDGDEPTGRLPEPSSEPDVTGEIRSDSAFRIDLDTGKRYRTYIVHVPSGSRSLLVRALGADADLDLYLRHEAPINDYGTDPDHRANSGRFEEQLYVDGQSDPPLRPGRYFLDVAKANPEAEVGVVDLEILFDQPEPEPLPAVSGPLRDIRIGERVSVDLEEEGRKGARFRFEVPARADSLDVRVMGATRDVDLFMRHDAVITDHNDNEGFDVKSVTARLNEHIHLDAESDPPLRPGTWYLDVASLLVSDTAISFDVEVTTGDQANREPLALPPYFEGETLTPLEEVLQAVVQVACENGSGSGTNLHKDGWIITNHHVIEDEGVVQQDDIYISFVQDFDEPPAQVFVAEVVEYDEELDLALLHVRADIYDRPVRNLDLPWLPLGDPDALHHGDPMYIAGFPSVGGFESRTTLSLTRGIVSGVLTDRDGNRTWIKTDARINAGNSGGTALDGNLGYVGVPSRERVADDDELGYSRPTTLIPEAWLRHFED